MRLEHLTGGPGPGLGHGIRSGPGHGLGHKLSPGPSPTRPRLRPRIHPRPQPQLGAQRLILCLRNKLQPGRERRRGSFALPEREPRVAEAAGSPSLGLRRVPRPQLGPAGAEGVAQLPTQPIVFEDRRLTFFIVLLFCSVVSAAGSRWRTGLRFV